MPFSTGKDLATKFRFRSGLADEKLGVLRAAWEKEAGHFASFFELKGVKRGNLFVRAKSPAAAQELMMRAPEIVAGLNKYFDRKWIKGIKLCR